MTHTSKDQFWKDEAGTVIPFNRITTYERKRERAAAMLHKGAKAISAQLSAYKKTMRELCNEVYEEFMASKESDRLAKGNFTWHNFDRSIKVEVSINDRIEFDDLHVKSAKEKFDTFMDINVESKNAFVKEMIMSAFQTSKGKLDTKRVFDLIRYRSKINDALFSEACAVLEAGIRRPDSRTYFRVWERTGKDGEYQLIDLNFSSI
ncbi:MAG: DUF3164 family protein [Gammaproteobacteria bacterium]|nr:DUF3164 family protein [Gammaproteobacteria bacterium]